MGAGQARPLQTADTTPLLGPSSLPPPTSKLKEEDFPSLCASVASPSSSSAALGPSGPALASHVSARGRGTFQEDDFPALVPSASKPSSAPTSLISAWNSSGSQKAARPSAGAPAAGGSGQPSRKAGRGGKGSKKGGPPPLEEEEGGGRAGLTAQELRSVPPTVAVSSLLALASTQTVTKVGKKKKVGAEKPGAASPPPPPADRDGPPGAEQAPGAPAGRAEGPVAVIVNGHTEGPAPARSTPKEPPGLPRPLGPLSCPTAQEDFPALGVPCPPRMPPPPGTWVWLRPASGQLGRGWVVKSDWSPWAREEGAVPRGTHWPAGRDRAACEVGVSRLGSLAAPPRGVRSPSLPLTSQYARGGSLLRAANAQGSSAGVLAFRRACRQGEPHSQGHVLGLVIPPPAGFNAVVLLKGTPPPPPPGLVPPVSKPPPGFSGLLPGPHPACVPSTATTTKA